MVEVWETGVFAGGFSCGVEDCKNDAFACLFERLVPVLAAMKTLHSNAAVYRDKSRGREIGSVEEQELRRDLNTGRKH
jgi:hypothetical protein